MVFFFEDVFFPRVCFSVLVCIIIVTYHFDLFCFLFHCFASQIAMFWEHIKVFSFCTHNEFLSFCFSQTIDYNNNGNVLVPTFHYLGSFSAKLAGV